MALFLRLYESHAFATLLSSAFKNPSSRLLPPEDYLLAFALSARQNPKENIWKRKHLASVLYVSSQLLARATFVNNIRNVNMDADKAGEIRTPSRVARDRVNGGLPFTSYFLKALAHGPNAQSVGVIVKWVTDDIIIMNLKTWKEQELDDPVRFAELKANMDANYSTWLDHVDAAVQTMISLATVPNADEALVAERRVARWTVFVMNILSARKVPGEDLLAPDSHNKVVFRYSAAYHLLLTALIDVQLNHYGFFQGKLGGPNVQYFGHKEKENSRKSRKRINPFISDSSDDGSRNSAEIKRTQFIRAVEIRKPRAQFGESPWGGSSEEKAGPPLSSTYLKGNEKTPMRDLDTGKDLSIPEETGYTTPAGPPITKSSEKKKSGHPSACAGVAPPEKQAMKGVKTRVDNSTTNIFREWSNQQYGGTTLGIQTVMSNSLNAMELEVESTKKKVKDQAEELANCKKQLKRATETLKKRDEEVQKLKEKLGVRDGE